jgi:hypothetical protein
MAIKFRNDKLLKKKGIFVMEFVIKFRGNFLEFEGLLIVDTHWKIFFFVLSIKINESVNCKQEKVNIFPYIIKRF